MNKTSSYAAISPILYQSDFSSSSMEMVKLKHTDNNGVEVSIKTPIFTGQEKLEGLHHVIERFKGAALEFGLTTGVQHIEKFSKVLTDQPFSEWTTIRATLGRGNIALPRFWEAVSRLRRNYGGGRKARNNIINYLKSYNCNKPRQSSVEQHVRRLQHIIAIANEAEGTEPEINDAHRNRIILHSLPQVWQNNWDITGKDIENEDLWDIIEYFANQKKTFDAKNDNRTSKRKNNGYKKYDNQKKSKNKTSDTPPPVITFNSKCPIHPNGSHKWGECFQNIRNHGNNFQGRGRGGRGGRGGGRGHNNGRGNQSGRGRGQGNYQNNQQNNEQHSQETGNDSTINSESHVYDDIGMTNNARSTDNVSTSQVSWTSYRSDGAFH